MKNKNIEKTEKKDRKFWDYILKQKMVILGFVFGLVLGFGIMSAFIPEQIAKLSDGSESVVLYESGSVSSDELYSKLKSLTNISVLIDMVDAKLLESKYPYETYYEKAVKQADENIAYAKQNGLSETDFLNYYGFTDYASFVKYLTLDGQRYEYYQDYLKSQIKEKDMKDYYKNNAYGDIKTQYISVEVNNESNADETLIKEILEKVKKGKTYKELAKAYEKNKSVIFDDLGYVSFDAMPDSAYEKQLLSMKNNTSASTYVKTETYGYTIIFRADQKEKEDYEDVDSVIQGILMRKLDASDKNLYINTFINMRKDAKLKFTDTSFDKLYKEYLKKYK